MKAMTRIALVAAAILGLAILGAWLWYRGVDRDLTQPPARVAAVAPQVTPSSHVVIPIEIRTQALEQLAAELPQTFALPLDNIGMGQWWNAANLELRGEIRRGPIKVSSVDDGVIVADAPIGLGIGVARGTAVQALEVGAHATARATLDVAPDWQLVPGVAIAYEWSQRPEQRVLGMRVDATPLASMALDLMLRQLERTIITELPRRAPPRPAMEQLWRRLHEPLQLSQAPEIWLRPDPVAVFMPPPTSLHGAHSMLIGVDAQLRIVHGPKPAAADAEPLPPLIKAITRTPGIAIAAPIDIDYATLRQSLQHALSARPVVLAVPRLGPVEITFEDFKVYPATPAVVIGAKVAVDTPNRWLDTRGWIYLRGEPRYDPATMRVHVDNLDFSRDLDNALVNLLSAAARQRIRTELSRATTIDLSPQIRQLRALVDQRMNTTLGEVIPEPALSPSTRQLFGSRLQATGGVTNLRVHSVVPGETGLTINAQLDADLTLHLQEQEALQSPTPAAPLGSDKQPLAGESNARARSLERDTPLL